MNDKTLITLQRMTNEIQAAVQDDLAKHSDEELMLLIDAHLRTPAVIVAVAMSNPNKLATMAAVPLYRERLRRAELRAMR